MRMASVLPRRNFLPVVTVKIIYLKKKIRQQATFIPFEEFGLVTVSNYF